ncbi:flagellar assembly peptidoglycan hydrolase FlgJ [Pseudomarimonas salicorniae]|uniref:Peptidoglycan hydrolase FlgJ n=1 Tax=Pseudomarimonas salicorniae TaxID=2933270 RepID=A0ABT0GKU5_9GAMM|nr:flagellar assembly peptidoglycan hydrolase FlgJ [Lysobacter sp. CAU 1642]MCK7595163.1 flagellar assembly peptidoglycan hydrolase FlgJ [Lysobacter sp. CAU 1642]
MELRPASLALRPVDTGNSPESIANAARQLESQFAKMMIGMMRQSAMGDSMFPGAAGQFRDLYDRELANVITKGKGLGLQPMIRRSLGETQAADGAAAAAQASYGLEAYRARQPTLQQLRPTLAQPIPISRIDAAEGHPRAHGALAVDEPSPALQRTPDLDRSPATAYASSVPGNPEDFVREMWPHAQRAAAELGVSPRAILAQAALETGWGKHLPRRADGTPSNNVFGIKASGGWQGESLTRATREFVNGREVGEQASFRAYGSTEHGFSDYVALLKNSPRYAKVVGQSDTRAFAQALQRAGYATDPHYAAKVAAIAEGPTLDRALARLDAATLSA